MKRIPTLAALMSLLVASGLLGACSPDSSAADRSADAAPAAANAGDMPPIHVVQTHWVVLQGKPAAETSYREALAKCQHDAPQDTVPLPEDVASQLGRERDEYWLQGGRTSKRSELWKFEFDQGQGCHFKPVRESRLDVDDGHELYQIDLADKSGTRQPWEQDDQGAAEELTDEVIAEAQRNGERFLGKQMVAGQPCLAWERGPDMPDAGYRACNWTGGERWGIGSTGVDNSDSAGFSVLWARPAKGQNGWVYQTQAMTVGEPIDPKVFKVPSGIRIRDAQ